MSQCEATREADWITPVMVSSDGKAAAAVLATSTTAANIDLTTLPGLSDRAPVDKRTQQPNVLGHYVSITAIGADAYVSFAQAAADVQTGNVPNPATTGTNVAGLCEPIPAGTTAHFKLPLGPLNDPANAGAPVKPGQLSPARFLAYVTKAGTGTLIVRRSTFT